MGIGCLRHDVLPVCGAPCQLRLLAGQEHDRTIPLAEMDCVNAITGKVKNVRVGAGMAGLGAEKS